ncbi:IS701 family transposase [Nonomuraea sp. NPDC049649]|jgi:SRSO17 transposase|uniref:IS701 family transposase n=1 Tax=unclassified Nonomuraea TaxID=2593643 RepID=UPI003250B08A
MARIAPCFPRRESRATCAQMLAGLLMELEDKNCWTLAEAAGHPTPDRLQHFLARASWDEQQVTAQAARWAIEHLDDGDPDHAVLIIDETADAKSSTDAAAAARQYSGTLGGVALCQVAVHLAYATPRGHTILDRALYLPASRAADDEHRELAHIPEQTMFATKPQLAGDLLQRAHATGIRAAFVTGDEVYGGRELRTLIRTLLLGYVLAVRSSTTIITHAGRTLAAKDAATLIPAGAWMRLRTGSGTKGTRHYDWAMLAIRPDDTPDEHDPGHAALLIRRHRYTGQMSFYRCWSPHPVPLARLIHVATSRWRIEEDHQLAKQTCGLDAGQVIRWRSWHRWSTMALLAYAFIAVATAYQRQLDGPLAEHLGLVAIAIPELLRQLRGVVIPDPRRDPEHRLTWSIWRRRHQYRARLCHQRWHTYAETTP